MKNFLFLFVTLVSIQLSCAQLKGVDFELAKEINTQKDSEFENNKRVLLKDETGSYLIYYGSPTNVSIQRAIEKAMKLCDENELDFKKPSIDNTILDEDVKSIHDYGKLKNSLFFEESEVDQTYYNQEGSGFRLFMNKTFIAILFILN